MWTVSYPVCPLRFLQRRWDNKSFVVQNLLCVKMDSLLRSNIHCRCIQIFAEALQRWNSVLRSETSRRLLFIGARRERYEAALSVLVIFCMDGISRFWIWFTWFVSGIEQQAVYGLDEKVLAVAGVGQGQMRGGALTAPVLGTKWRYPPFGIMRMEMILLCEILNNGCIIRRKKWKRSFLVGFWLLVCCV